jgi:hypothetical protein
MLNIKKYVVLEHLTLPDKGYRFWTHNTEDNTHSIWGDLWYKEILFTDSEEEAIEESKKYGETISMNELEEYYANILKYYENENKKK